LESFRVGLVLAHDLEGLVGTGAKGITNSVGGSALLLSESGINGLM
jgi:hypothetical protein